MHLSERGERQGAYAEGRSGRRGGCTTTNLFRTLRSWKYRNLIQYIYLLTR